MGLEGSRRLLTVMDLVRGGRICAAAEVPSSALPKSGALSERASPSRRRARGRRLIGGSLVAPSSAASGEEAKASFDRAIAGSGSETGGGSAEMKVVAIQGGVGERGDVVGGQEPYWAPSRLRSDTLAPVPLTQHHEGSTVRKGNDSLNSPLSTAKYPVQGPGRTVDWPALGSQPYSAVLFLNCGAKRRSDDALTARIERVACVNKPHIPPQPLPPTRQPPHRPPPRHAPILRRRTPHCSKSSAHTLTFEQREKLTRRRRASSKHDRLRPKAKPTRGRCRTSRRRRRTRTETESSSCRRRRSRCSEPEPSSLRRHWHCSEPADRRRRSSEASKRRRRRRSGCAPSCRGGGTETEASCGLEGWCKGRDAESRRRGRGRCGGRCAETEGRLGSR